MTTENGSAFSMQEDYCSGKPGTKHSDAYYSGGQCTVCGYRGKLTYSRAFRYPELDSTIHLPNGGRVLLGHQLFATEKRDGSNIHFWKDQYGNTRITSRNGPSECLVCGWTGTGTDNKADHIKETQHDKWLPDSIAGDMKAAILRTVEYQRVIQMLTENPHWNIFCELIYSGQTPTKIEPKHKKESLILFDIAIGQEDLDSPVPNTDLGFQFVPYNFLHQMGYHFRIPVVKLFGEGRFTDMDSETGYWSWVRDLLKYSRRHRREGVVIKCYEIVKQVFEVKEGRVVTRTGQIFVKEKIDLPEKPKVVKIQTGEVQLPKLPDSEVYGALDKMTADFGLDFLRDKSKAMPKMVEYVKVEAQKHQMAMPGSLYPFYVTYLAAKVLA